MGTPDFAVPSLKRLTSEHDVVAVYVRPDAVSGRGRTERPCAVKVAALQLGLDVRQPVSLRDAEVQAELTRSVPDIVCVAAYGLILPKAVLGVAELGAVNVHASLLPRWRGAAPIQRAILAGDEHLGVSIMQMEVGLDTGPYCLQGDVTADAKGATELTRELADLGAELLAQALPTIASGSVVWTAQAEEDATYAEKVTKNDVAPDPALDAASNVRRIRASGPAAPARILLAGKGVTLMDGAPVSSSSRMGPGEVFATDEGIVLGTVSGALQAGRVKPDGKPEMDAAAWVRGARLAEGAIWACAR